MQNFSHLSRLALGTVCAIVLAGCGSSSGGGRDGAAPIGTPPPGAEARQGVSENVTLVSDLDGEAIAFTVHEPTAFVEGVAYPLVLQSHGYGGNRVAADARPAEGDPGTFGRLLDAGYGVISIDQRGHGDSGGQIRVLDPEVEGRDLVQIVDWAETNLDWLAFRDGNLVLGATGGSYGGGFQHVLLAVDPAQRLDALVPEITWHDLRFSLFPGMAFKTFWATLLSASGSTTSGGQDPEVNQGLISGLTLNMLNDEQQALLASSSMVSFCADDRIPAIDVMYWQSPGDTLFNLNEAVDNFRCTQARGGDVRLLTKNGGHDSIVGAPSGEACGALDKTQAIVDWFDEKLRGIPGRADNIPTFCWQLDNSADDAVVTESLPVPQTPIQVPPQTVSTLAGGPLQVSVPLLTVGPEGAVIAGVPSINISIRSLTGSEALDPIVFTTLAVRRAGEATDTVLQANQSRPFRGFMEAVDSELIGVSNRLAPGDEIRLLVSASNLARFATSGSLLPAIIELEAFVGLPLLPNDLPAPPDNTAD